MLHPSPAPAFHSLPPSSFSPAPCQGLLTWPTDDVGRDSPENRFALCQEDVHEQCALLGARASPLPFPKTETSDGGHSEYPPPRAAVPPAPPTAVKHGHRIKYGRRVCGASESEGWPQCPCPHPFCRRMCSPQGQQSLPERSFGASCAAAALPYQHGHLQYTHRSGNFISYTGMEWFWGWP